MTLILIHLNVIHFKNTHTNVHVRHSLSAACEKYIPLDQRIKECKLKASQIHLNSTLTVTDWRCCSHGACLQNGLLLFTNAASAPSGQSCSVYAKRQHNFHRKDEQSGLSTMNNSLMEALLQFGLTNLFAESQRKPKLARLGLEM